MRRALFYGWMASWRIFQGPPGSWRWKISAFFLSRAVIRAYASYNPEDEYEKCGDRLLPKP